jgi:starvation-inducible DNA-binding protein
MSPRGDGTGTGVHHPRHGTIVKGGADIPAALATVTDLRADETRAIADAVNPLIADAFALYVKTKSFHWHLSGPRFRDYHLLFDEHAAVILDSIDVLAERVRKIGGLTLRSIGHISQLQKIPDDNDTYVPAMEMIRRLLEDNRQMAERQRAAIEVCDNHRDTPTGNLLQEILDQTERRIWFLFEIGQDGR